MVSDVLEFILWLPLSIGFGQVYLVDQQGLVGVYFNIRREALEQVISVDQQS